VQRIDEKRAGDLEGQQRSRTNPGQEDTLARTHVCKRLLGRVAGLLLAGVLAACGATPPGQAGGQDAGPPAPAASPAATARGRTSATPAAATPATPAATARGRPPATPGGGIAVDVTPGSVAVGAVTLSLALEPARPMFDQAAVLNADPAQQGQDTAKTQNAGSFILAGGVTRVTNNLDPSQAPPPDVPQAIIRHVVVQVKTADHDQPVPYLALTMDVLLDGRPVLFDQPLAPLVTADKDTPRLYYGNNVKFPQVGVYQIFVRTQRSPVLGKEQPPAAQFNLTLR